MFNPWKHLRVAGGLAMLLGWAMPGNEQLTGLGVVLLGFAFLLVGLVGGLDLAERRVELLEKILTKENTNEDERPH